MFSDEGSLRITALEPESTTKPATYGVTFAPYHRGGGALKILICYGENKLADVLREMGIQFEKIEEALQSVRKSAAASIPNVVLTEEQLHRYGLGEIGIGESIRGYLGLLSTST